MNIRPHTLVILSLASAVTGAVVGVGVFWIAVLRDDAKPPEPSKTTAELLVGK